MKPTSKYLIIWEAYDDGDDVFPSVVNLNRVWQLQTTAFV